MEGEYLVWEEKENFRGFRVIDLATIDLYETFKC